jgi:hypothetical protein
MEWRVDDVNGTLENENITMLLILRFVMNERLSK